MNCKLGECYFLGLRKPLIRYIVSGISDVSLVDF